MDVSRAPFKRERTVARLSVRTRPDHEVVARGSYMSELVAQREGPKFRGQVLNGLGIDDEMPLQAERSNRVGGQLVGWPASHPSRDGRYRRLPDT
jgi:hypothetical protein